MLLRAYPYNRSILMIIMTRRQIALSPMAENAAKLFGTQIRRARHAKRWTAAELAERSGVSRLTVLNAETGSPNVSLGNALNIASIVGVTLFGIDDPVELARARLRGEEQLALLPSRVDKVRNTTEGEYDF
jgi:transcriptional regulator with XRE-family HTH domain